MSKPKEHHLPNREDFDYLEYTKKWNYANPSFFYSRFTTMCGVTVSHDPCMIRVHLLLTTARGEEALDSALGVSYPLYGSADQDWDPTMVQQLLLKQSLHFTNQLLNKVTMEEIMNLWSNAEIRSTNQVDDTGTMHVTIRLLIQYRGPIGYFYIHKDHSSKEALDRAKNQWNYI